MMSRQIVLAGFVLLARVAFPSVTIHFALDCREGAREISADGEELCYDVGWYVDGGQVRITDNGELIETGRVGTKHWAPADSQCHQLQMTVVDGGGLLVGSEDAYFIRIPQDGSVVIPLGWTEVPANIFKNCDWLTSVTIPTSVARVGAGAFTGCPNISSITVPASVNVASVFTESKAMIREVSITGKGAIPASAYAGCTALERVNVVSIVDWMALSFVNPTANPLSTGAKLYVDGTGVTELDIPEGMTEIGGYAFAGGTFTSVTIPLSVTSVGGGAFVGCSKLTSVVLPGGFEIASVFPDSYKTITTFVVADGSASIRDSAFSGCTGLTSVTLPESVKSIGQSAFAGCDALSRVNFPSNLLVTSSLLGEWGLSEAAVERISEDYSVDNFVIINSTLLAYVGPADVKEVVIPDGVAIIDERAFAGLGSLEKVTIPASVREIRASAFATDTRLANVVLPEGLELIEDEAFYGCAKLANVIVPGSVKSVGKRAFKQCTAMTNAQIAYGVGSIGEECFSGDWRISEVDLPSTVTNIGINAFGGDSSIIRAGLRCDVRKMSEIFSNYAHIREVIVKDGDGEIIDGCFKNCIELKDVRYMGDCPALENSGRNLYANTFSSNGLTLVSYVLPGSTGWDGIATSDELPQAWPLVGSYRRPIAHWDVPTYLCRFDSNGGTLGVQDTYQYSEKYVVLPPEPVQSGYRFAGWWTQPVGGLRVTERTIFIEGVYTYLWAHWEKGHTVFLDPNGGTIINDFVTYVDESVYGVLPSPVRSGYAFDGWLYNGEKIEPDSKINEQADHTLIAQWRANNYKVKYHPNGGTGDLVVENWIYGESKVLHRNSFVREGYEFAGWATSEKGPVVYADGASVSSLTAEPNGVVSLYAVWQVGANVVSFNGNGGTPSETSRRVQTNAQLGALPSATRMGWTFVGWFTAASGGTQATAATVVTANVTYYAQWTANAYSVKFDANGGSGTMANESMTYDAAKALTACAFTRKGYTFAGWAASAGGVVKYANGATVKNLTATAGGTVTLYAKWTPNNYMVDFNPGQGGTGTMSDQPMTYDEETALYANLFARTGYTFLGWTDDEGELEEVLYYDGVVVSNLTDEVDGEYDLYAVWAANEYTVRFNANGGTGEMADQLFLYDAAQLLAANKFIRTGFAFAGWAKTAGGAVAYAGGAAVNNLTAEPDGVVTLYAQWTANAYSVKFDANGGNGTMADQAFVYDEEQALRANEFTRTGYAFAGWYVSAPRSEDAAGTVGDGATVKNLTATANATVTLYAHWEEVGGGDDPGGDGPEPPVAAGGTVTPPKSLKVGGTATWKAKAGQGCVFTGWEWVNGAPSEAFLVLSENERRNPTLKLKVSDGMRPTDVGTTWVWIDEDRIQSVELTSGGLDVICKSYVTASVSGLPSGLKFDKKTLEITGAAKKDGMKVVKVSVKNASGYTWKENWMVTTSGGKVTRIEPVSGSHTAAGTPVEVWGDAQFGTVKGSKVYVVGKKASIKATPAKGSIFLGWYDDAEFTRLADWLPKGPRKASQSVVVTGELHLFARFVELKPWAVGTFNGGGDEGGLVTLTIGKTSKVSGKFLADGKKWKLSAAAFTDHAETNGVEAFFTTVTAKCGKEEMAVEVEVTASGVVGRYCASTRDASGTVLFEAYRNGWKEEPLKTVAKTLKGKKVSVAAPRSEDAAGTVLLTVGANGAVKAKGTFDGYSASCSTVLIPTETKNEYLVYVYFPPKAGKFDGFSSSYVIRL